MVANYECGRLLIVIVLLWDEETVKISLLALYNMRVIVLRVFFPEFHGVNLDMS